ncbi:MAG: ABC transporter substrate-binding protein [Christensenellaceae bacterium]
MKKILAFLVGSTMFLGLAGCAPKTSKTLVRVNEVTHSVFYAPFYLADRLGYFADEGLEIELTNGGGADNTMAALLSGSADIGFCGPEAALYVLAGGSTDAPVVFGQLTKRDGSFLVSREEEPDFSWQDLSGKEILAGRRGGVPAMTFEYVLKSNDVTDALLNYDVAFNLMVGAFEGGTADYCTMFEPTASEYQAAGKGYIVASVGEASGEVPYTCFSAKQSWLSKNSETAEKFLRAVTRAVKTTMEADTTELANLLTKSFESTSLASLRTSIESYKRIDAWRTELTMTEASLDRLQDIMESAGELPERVSYTALVDNTLAERAYRDVYGK